MMSCLRKVRSGVYQQYDGNCLDKRDNNTNISFAIDIMKLQSQSYCYCQDSPRKTKPEFLKYSRFVTRRFLINYDARRGISV